MASLLDKLKRFLHSPQGHRLTQQAKQMARDPHKRAQAQQMLRKFRKR
ncbi:hypothetical protein [Lentzea tibetensis]|nr:hypothetical protein [Lentzea tibetensis]